MVFDLWSLFKHYRIEIMNYFQMKPAQRGRHKVFMNQAHFFSYNAELFDTVHCSVTTEKAFNSKRDT
ncbi:CLUMA_CG017404, isoform A [Clunio marinus]|uniref:CLUMA_CG017404, isoform A n=1 Tax=Clunio marinus TaxID=568069 RepID=A0A1J1IX74_9DIPT|nr:CLUMA_CG017404, isoform A [Clunio marinus]